MWNTINVIDFCFVVHNCLITYGLLWKQYKSVSIFTYGQPYINKRVLCVFLIKFWHGVVKIKDKLSTLYV